MDNPKETRESRLPAPKTFVAKKIGNVSRYPQPEVWIAGDKYHEEATFDGVKLMPPDVQTIAGGVWYVKRFLDQVSDNKGANEFKVSTYQMTTISGKDTMAASHRFKSYPSRPEKENNESHAQDVLRILNTQYSPPPQMDFAQYPAGVTPKLLVIEDMNMGYRVNGKVEWENLLGRMKENRSISSSVDIVVLLGGILADFEANDKDAKQKNELWKLLSTEHRENTLVIVNADLLRFTGANISRRISWEKTGQDLVNELRRHPRLQHLSEFAHLVVRFGVTAAVHCYSIGATRVYKLYYDTKAHDGVFRDVSTEGGIIGNNSVFTACIVKELVKADNHIGILTKIGSAIVAAIPACQKFFRFGYPMITEENKAEWLDDWPSKSIFDDTSFDELLRLPGKEFRYHPTCRGLVRYADIPVGAEGWTILNQSTTGKSVMQLAQGIAFYGVKNSLNVPLSHARSKHSHTHAPTARFNDITALDRDEIESFRGVYNLIKEYIDSHDTKPLNLAIFGPPGSGKSSLVRAIVEEIKYKDDWQLKVVNMTQITTVGELNDRVRTICGAANANKVDLHAVAATKSENKTNIPLIFFDEFDCDYNGPLGWLKSFLPLMEDGVIEPSGGCPDTIEIGKAVLFFAGGTKYSYNQFSLEVSSANEQDKLAFQLAKGPDFVSRLRGHVNIKGVNRIDASDAAFLLRRATMLRDVLTRAGMVYNDVALIDASIVHAMLSVQFYKHGARSVRSIIAMCARLWGRIEKASLPSDRLLDMHVDSHEFRSLVEEYQPQGDDPEPAIQFYIMS